jgi:hypothetical protein
MPRNFLVQNGTGTPSPTSLWDVIQSSDVTVSAGGKITWVLAAGTPITQGNDKAAWAIMDQARTMSKVYACAKTAPTGTPTLVFDILYSTDNGTTFNSLWPTNQNNRPSIASGSKFSTTTSFDTTTIPAGALVRIDVVSVGNTIAGQDVTVQLQYQ